MRKGHIGAAREACERLELALGDELRKADMDFTRVGISVGGKVRWERLM